MVMFSVIQIKSISHFTRAELSITFGPFNSACQRRWKKPANTAQTRLENRTINSKLDRVASWHSKLSTALELINLMSKRSGPYVSMQTMSRWGNLVGLNISVGEFLRKYPHVFEIFTHPVKRNLCCRVTDKMLDLISEEDCVRRQSEMENVQRLKKLMMMSKSGTLHLHALRLTRSELGLPSDFSESVIGKHPEEFKLVDSEIVGLIATDEDLGVAEVEKWREKEYDEKWLSEYETKYAFPINIPTGFRIKRGFKERLSNWQRLPYVKPYENVITRSRTNSGVEQFEKRVVGILHEFLSLTVEKTMEVQRFAHFRRDLGMDVNIRELLLAHPGVFYISTKGSSSTVFLREAYTKGCLVEPNPLYNVRRKMMEIMWLGQRHTSVVKLDEPTEDKSTLVRKESSVGLINGGWVIPLLEDHQE